MTDPLTPQVKAALDKLEPAIRKAFLEAVEAVTSSAQLRVIIGHLEAGNVNAAITALRLDAAFFGPLDRAINESFYQGGVMALANLPSLSDPFPGAKLCWALADATPAQRNGSEHARERS